MLEESKSPREDDAPASDSGGQSRQDWTAPRFVVTAESWGEDSSAWFQIYETAGAGMEHKVDEVQPPTGTPRTSGR